ILSGLTSNDRAALISCASHSEVLSGAAPPEALGRLVKELQPTFGAAKVGEGLRLAGNIVSTAGRDILSTIYVISDLQWSGCKELSSCAVPSEIELKIIQTGDLATPNSAVTQLQLDTREGSKAH